MDVIILSMPKFDPIKICKKGHWLIGQLVEIIVQ